MARSDLLSKEVQGIQKVGKKKYFYVHRDEKNLLCWRREEVSFENVIRVKQTILVPS